MSLQPHGLRRRGPIEHDHGTSNPNRERPSTNDVRRLPKICMCMCHVSSDKELLIRATRFKRFACSSKRIMREDPSPTP
ncbi:hypothetical protein HN011_004783 [Eciton burchellii]|nr:hypothetical protein HN011_004783 [Eciton burchellii]